MRIKHNKKRNTAFIYEALIVEATLAILKKNEPRQQQVFDILKRHFRGGTALNSDLNCYRSLYKNQNLSISTCKRILNETRLQQKELDNDIIFKMQSALLKDVNKNLGSYVFNNFVPNYKTLATIAQMFSEKTTPKNKIILENRLLSNMSIEIPRQEYEKLDNVVLKTFIEKFNSKYDSCLLQEQKELLLQYVSSFADNAVSLKVFLNEEIPRLKRALEEAKRFDDIRTDQNMIDKASLIIDKLESYAKQPISEGLLLTVLKTQSLIKEIYTDGDSS